MTLTAARLQRPSPLAQTLSGFGIGAAWCAVLTMLLAALPAGAAMPAPDFTLKSVRGDNLRLLDFRGSVVMLTFVKDRCRSCEQQLRALDELSKRYQGMRVLGIASDLSAERAAALTSGLNLSFPILLDRDGHAAQLYQTTLMPLLVVIDKNGQRRYQHQDYRAADEREYETELRQLLNEWQ